MESKFWGDVECEVNLGNCSLFVLGIFIELQIYIQMLILKDKDCCFINLSQIFMCCHQNVSFDNNFVSDVKLLSW